MSKQPLITGNLNQCLADYAHRFERTAGRTLMLEFVQSKPDTVRVWLNGNSTPAGALLLRLRCFLELVGYQVSEFTELSEPTRQVSRMVAFDVMDFEEVRLALGYQDVHGVYGVLLRGKGLMPDKAWRLNKLAETETDLNIRQEQWRQRIATELFSISSAIQAEERVKNPVKPIPRPKPAASPVRVRSSEEANIITILPVSRLVEGAVNSFYLAEVLCQAIEDSDEPDLIASKVRAKMGKRLPALIARLQLLED